MILRTKLRAKITTGLVASILAISITGGEPPVLGSSDPLSIDPSAGLEVIDYTHTSFRRNLRQPSIVTQPRDQSVFFGADAVFQVVAAGTPPLHFQWRLNGKEIAAGIKDTLKIQNVGLADFGSYDVIIFNTRGFVTSERVLLTASFTLSINPTVGGTVALSPSQTGYKTNSIVTVTASPKFGYAFDRWTDDTNSFENPLLIQMNRNRTLTANFVANGVPFVSIDGEPGKTFNFTNRPSATVELTTTFVNGSIFYTLDGTEPRLDSKLYSAPFELTNAATVRALAYSTNLIMTVSEPVPINLWFMHELTARTDGGGTITVSPSEGPYRNDVEVSLDATPDAGWVFLGWKGDASVNSGHTTLLMDGTKAVEAVFGTPITTMTSGNGSVVLNPLLSLYPYGTAVQIQAVPRNGGFFALWGINGSGNKNPIELIVTNSHPTYSALFAPLEAGKTSLAAISNGRGKITVAPSGNIFNKGEQITLSAEPSPGESFLAWSGNAFGTNNSITVTMDSSKVVTAHFSGGAPPLEIREFVLHPDEGFQLSFSGEPNRGFVIEYSADFKNWTRLGALLAGPEGLNRITDSKTAGSSQRFYRVVSE